MSQELWRPSLTLSGFLVSSYGRIMRIPYTSKMPKGGYRVYGGEPHYGTWDGSRFIYSFKGGKTYKIHRLVCEAFHGPPPFDEAIVMHLNEDSSDNRPENLEWGTQKENLNAPGFLEYCKSRTGENSPRVKGNVRKSA